MLDEIFTAAGASLREEVELVRLDPQYRIIFGGGGELNATPDIARMEQQIGAIAPEDAPGFRRFLEENRAKLDRMLPCLENPFLGWQDMLNLRMLKTLPILRPHQSSGHLSLALFPRLPHPARLFFPVQIFRHVAVPLPEPVLNSLVSGIRIRRLPSDRRLRRGDCRDGADRGTAWRGNLPSISLSKKFCLKADARSACERGKAFHRADALIVNADFARAMSRLVPDRLRHRWTDRKIARKKFSCSTFMMYLGVEGRFDLPHHNIHIADDYARNLDEIENQHVLSGDPSFYVQNASVTDPTLAPRGMSTLYVLAPVTHQHSNVDWARERDCFRALMLKQIGKAGFADVEERIRFERVITPADWDRQYEIHKGATFNLAHSLDQMLHFRPHNRFEDLDGVYLVGGGTHPGSGLPVIFESARISTRLLLVDLGVDHSRRASSPRRSSPR